MQTVITNAPSSTTPFAQGTITGITGTNAGLTRTIAGLEEQQKKTEQLKHLTEEWTKSLEAESRKNVEQLMEVSAERIKAVGEGSLDTVEKRFGELINRVGASDFPELKQQFEDAVYSSALAGYQKFIGVVPGVTRPGRHDRAILHLSRGGSDACVLREYDIAGQRFVPGSFTLPEAKGGAVWLDNLYNRRTAT